MLHNFIVESCGSTVLARSIRSLQDRFTRFRTLSPNIPEKILSSHHEHLGILKALKQGDGDAAEKLIYDHFDHARRFLPDNLLRHSANSHSLFVVAT